MSFLVAKTSKLISLVPGISLPGWFLVGGRGSLGLSRGLYADWPSGRAWIVRGIQMIRPILLLGNRFLSLLNGFFLGSVALLCLASIAVYVVSTNIVLVEGRRIGLLERTFAEEHARQRRLLAERATLYSPVTIKARATEMGMVEIADIRFVGEKETVAIENAR